MPNTNPFRFPRLRFRLLSFFHPRPARLTYQEALGNINVQAARTSGALYNAPTATPASADVWVHPQLPTVAELSPARPVEPFIRFTEPFERAQAINDAARRRRTIQLHERTLTLHELPAMPRALRAFIDAQSNETPPEQPAWNCYVAVTEEDEDATEQMTALQKLARKMV